MHRFASRCIALHRIPLHPIPSHRIAHRIGRELDNGRRARSSLRSSPRTTRVSLLKNPLCLRPHTLERIHQHERSIDHRKDALDLAAKVLVTRRVHNVQLVVSPVDTRRLGHDRDAALRLELERVQQAVFVPLDLNPASLEQLVDQRRLAVVDVGHHRNVADLLGGPRRRR